MQRFLIEREIEGAADLTEEQLDEGVAALDAALSIADAKI